MQEIVDETTLGGTRPLTPAQAETVYDWLTETNYPGWHADPSDVAPINNHWDGGPHINIPGVGRPGGHVPV
ncbi:MAG: hypothetical protein MUF06_21265, partial [Pirellulaceae bacterium]|nr:hypothetical protein [Pirellulaceae bacterium]